MAESNEETEKDGETALRYRERIVEERIVSLLSHIV
jgi:hypothetical protein